MQSESPWRTWQTDPGKVMTEHFPKSCETATAWCKKCGRTTEHRVDGGRLGPCIDPKHPAPLPRAVIPPLGEPAQGDLFKKK